MRSIRVPSSPTVEARPVHQTPAKCPLRYPSKEKRNENERKQTNASRVPRPKDLKPSQRCAKMQCWYNSNKGKISKPRHEGRYVDAKSVSEKPQDMETPRHASTLVLNTSTTAALELESTTAQPRARPQACSRRTHPEMQ